MNFDSTGLSYRRNIAGLIDKYVQSVKEDDFDKLEDDICDVVEHYISKAYRQGVEDARQEQANTPPSVQTPSF